MPTRPTLTPPQIEALQARFALRVGARLDEGAQSLPHDVTERLRVARLQAVASAREARRLHAAVAARPAGEAARAVAAAPALALAGAGGTAGDQPPFSMNVSGLFPAPGADTPRADDGAGSWLWRLAAALPALALVLGLWGIGAWQYRQQVQAAAEVDTALLTDDLPPSAYSDPGFEEFLRTETPVSNVAPALAEEPGDDAVERDVPVLPPDVGPDTALAPTGPALIAA